MAKKKGLKLLNVLTGLFLGLFIGFLLGLSISEIVGTIAALFVSAAIVFLGFSDKVKTEADESFEKNQLKLIRTIVLCISCIVGIVLGILIRTHNILGTSSLQAKLSELESVGFSNEESLEIIKSQLISKKDTEIEDKRGTGVLFSFENGGKQKINCGDTNPYFLADFDEVFKAFEAEEGQLKEWSKLIKQNAEPEDYLTILKFIWRSYCD